MPDRKKSTAKRPPARSTGLTTSKDLDQRYAPEVEERSAFEAECQREMMHYAGQLCGVRARLWTLHVTIGTPLGESSMLDGSEPESLLYSMRGAIECACNDHLDPAIAALEKAAREDHWDLVAEWCERNGYPEPSPGTNAR